MGHTPSAPITSAATSGRRHLTAMLVLLVLDVIGGAIAVVSGVASWSVAWGFDTKFTVPLPIGAVQLILAWLAARNGRRRVALVAAVVLAVLCLISLLSGLFDGDLIHEVASSGYPGGVTWGIILLMATTVVGVLAIARARTLYRLR